MKLTILRTHTDGAKWVYGVADIDGVPFAVSMELPWNGNRRNISCIPSGIYKAIKTKSPKFGTVWMLDGVPGRSLILIHKANVAIRELQGCIAVGEKFDLLAGEDAILESKHAFDELMEKTKNENVITVEIRNVSTF